MKSRTAIFEFELSFLRLASCGGEWRLRGFLISAFRRTPHATNRQARRGMHIPVQPAAVYTEETGLPLNTSP